MRAEFETFLKELRRVKDQEEFDRFMQRVPQPDRDAAAKPPPEPENELQTSGAARPRFLFVAGMRFALPYDAQLLARIGTCAPP